MELIRPCPECQFLMTSGSREPCRSCTLSNSCFVPMGILVIEEEILCPVIH